MNAIKAWFRTVTLPQALIVLGVIAGTVAIGYRLPQDDLTQIIVYLVGGGAVVGTLLPGRKPAAPPRRLDGSVDSWLLWPLVAVFVALSMLLRAGLMR